MDYPSLGFSDDKITVSVNLFTRASNAFAGATIYAFDKASFLNAAASISVQRFVLTTRARRTPRRSPPAPAGQTSMLSRHGQEMPADRVLPWSCASAAMSRPALPASPRSALCRARQPGSCSRPSPISRRNAARPQRSRSETTGCRPSCCATGSSRAATPSCCRSATRRSAPSSGGAFRSPHGWLRSPGSSIPRAASWLIPRWPSTMSATR